MTKFDPPGLDEAIASAGGDIYDDEAAPVDEEDTPEPILEDDIVPEGEVEPEEQDPAEDRLYAGKYKSVEEMEKAYLEAQSALGREKSEKGDLRREFEDLKALVIEGPPPDANAEPWYRNVSAEDINSALAQDPGAVLTAIVKEELQRTVGPQLAEVTGKVAQTEQQQQQTAEVDLAYSQVADFWERNPQYKELEPQIGDVFADNVEIYSDAMFSGEQQKVDKAMRAMATMALSSNGATSPKAAAKAKARTAPVRGNRTPRAATSPAAQIIRNIAAAADAEHDLFA